MGKFVYFTSAEKRQANEVDLPSFLRDRGEKLLQAGREYRLASDHSITVRANRWYDHAARRGGHAISFVRQFYDKTFPEAVSMLLGRDGQGIIPIAKQEPEPQEPKPFALPKPYLTMRRMYAYLTKHRCIDRDVVTAFVQEKLLYEDDPHHNCVFVGLDENGAARHAHLRSTGSQGKVFRINVESSDLKHSFHKNGTDRSLYVFEAPIDLLSHITLYPAGWLEHSYVACCGTSIQPVLERLRQNPKLDTVYLCLDNDEAGEDACDGMMDTLEDNLWILLAAGGVMAAVIGCLTLLNNRYTLNNIKSKTVGDGQHGTARWATDAEIRKTYALVPFQAASWRKGLHRPEVQGLVLGSISHKHDITALVDKDDVHCLMIGASGVGKTAYFLYPNLEYACASGMSFLALDTKGDLARNYGAIAEKYYGYHVSVVDLRNPTRSDGYNLMTLINHYMDAAQATDSLAARAKAEKYAKILAKTIVSPNGDTDYGQNAYFYDAAEGLLTSVVLLLAEFLPPDRKQERRHIVSVFKLVQELLAPSGVRGKNWFTILMEKLPPEHKARWFAGAALNTSDQAMASVMSTVLSRLNAFLDSELEQVLCFDSSMNAERFAAEKSAIFLILPEEDQTKNFMAGLMIQTLARELFAVADENGGRLPGRVVFFCDELGTMPAFDILPLFSAGRSRGLTMVPIIQALAQLEKNYGREGAEILTDNCQDTIFGGFAPNSQTAEQLSKALGSRTVLSGSVSRSKNDPSQSLQMMERPLMTPDELKSIPKGSFVVMKTGTHPMQTKLRLFLDWGITFGEPYITPEHAARPVTYASRQELFLHIDRAYGKKNSQPTQVPVAERRSPYSAMGLYNEDART